MWQPKGFENPKYPHHVCKLQKAIYGLKQAPRAWFECLRNTLITWGFLNTKGDSSLFIHRTKSTITLLLIYVDDILVTGSYAAELQKFTTRLNQIFSFKDLENLHYFLGFKVTRDDTGLFLTQKKYILDLLAKFKLENASSTSTPMVAGK